MCESLLESHVLYEMGSTDAGDGEETAGSIVKVLHLNVRLVQDDKRRVLEVDGVKSL